MSFKELEIVELLAPARSWTNPLVTIPAGARGTVLTVFTDPREAYDVEFLNEDGSHLGIATVMPDGLKRVDAGHEIGEEHTK
jgi:hypothetical protein